MVHWRSNIRISFKSLGTHQSVDQSIYQWPPKTCMLKLMVMTSRNGNKSLSNKNEGWPARWLFPCRNRVWDSLGVRRNLYMVTWRDFFHDQVCLMAFTLWRMWKSFSNIHKKNTHASNHQLEMRHYSEHQNIFAKNLQRIHGSKIMEVSYGATSFLTKSKKVSILKWSAGEHLEKVQGFAPVFALLTCSDSTIETSKLWHKRLEERHRETGWLVVLTPLKNISQWEGLSHIL